MMRNSYKKMTRAVIALLFMMAAFSLNAQVSMYTFTQSSGTYTPITGTSVAVQTSASGTASTALDDVNYTVTIPFSFTYNGTAYTSCNVNTNGWIGIGTGTFSATNYSPLTSTDAVAGIVAAIGMDMNGGWATTGNRTLGSNTLTSVVNTTAVFIGATISGTGIPAGTTVTGFTANTITMSANATSTGTGATFQIWTGRINTDVTGAVGSQIFTIQWSGFRPYNSSNQTVNAQIKLYEGTNVIQFVYGTCLGSASTPQAGLRGATNADFNDRTTTTNWAATTAGGANSATLSYTTTVVPSVGYTYIWTPPVPCSGTPTAGTTTGPASICMSTNFTLSLTGATTGVTGLTYQWQSSPDNITYTNIAGATSATATVSQTSATYYQCIVTCSGSPATSTPLLVNMNSLFTCYCATSLASSTSNEEITNVTLNTLNNTSNCTVAAPGPGSIVTRYANYTSGAGAPAAPAIARGSSTSMTVTVGSCGATNFNSGLAVYIDFNQNGSFADAGEKVYSNGASANIACVPATVVSISFTPPAGATLGLTAMRIIDVEGTSGNSITSCGGYTYGETEDYKVNIVDLPPTPPTPVQSGTAPTCTSGTDLTVPGSPASGDAWYWQTSPTGTSTATPVSGAYTVFVNGTYYVRTYNATNALWSAASSSYTVTNIPVAPLPPAPTATTPACTSTSITVPAAAGSVTYYWQGTTSGGTSSALNASTPYTATTSGTYYVAAYDAATSCWSNTNGIAVVIDTYIPGAPTTTTPSLTICQGASSAMINAAGPTTGTLTASFGTSLVSPGIPTNFNITVPAIPSGATVTSTQLQIINAAAVGSSYRSEIRVALSGATTLAATQISTITSSGVITPDPSITVPALPAAGGAVTLTLSETFDDAGTDATFGEIKLVITYSLPASTITWWDASSAGTQIGTGSPFETVGTSVMPTSTPGTYTFYAQSNAGSCAGSSRLAIPVTVNPVLLTINPVNVTCNGGSNGSFTLGTVTCGLSPFTYSVNGGAFGPIPTNLTAGSYSIVAKDANGDNSASMPLTITQPTWTVPNATAGPAVAVCQNASSAIVSVTPPVVANPQTVVLSFNVAAQPAEVNAAPGNLVASAVMAALPAGSVVTSATLAYNNLNALGSSWQSDIRLGFSGAVTNAAAAGAGALNSAGTFNYTRAITPASVNVAGGTVNLLYWDFVSDNAGAEATFPTGAGVATLTITYNPAASITWYTASTGGTTLGTGATLETVGTSVLPTTATPGTYNFFAEPMYNGCTSPARTLVTVTVNALPVVSASSTATTLCAGSPVTLTGGGASTYTWTGGVTNAVSFSAPSSNTTYTVTGTDGNGCTNTSTMALTINALPTVTASSSSAAICNGSSVTLTGGGATTYSWTGSVSDGVAFSPSSTNTYTVTGTDGNGCTNTASATVVVNTLPTVTASPSTTAVCPGASVTLNGGGASTYTWTGSVSNGVAFTPASTATYTVTGTDGNGCTNTATSVVTVNTLPSVTASASAPAVCNGSSVTLTGGGATTYSWTSGVSDGVAFTPASSGTYTVTGTDGNGCTATASTSVTVNTLPTVTGSSTASAVCAGTAVTLTGSGASSYSWTGGVSDGVSFTPLASDTYTVTGTDGNGCTNTSIVTVDVNANPSVMAMATATTVCSGTSVTLSGMGALTYVWDNSVSDGVAFVPASTLLYSVTGTDVNGCTGTSSVTVTVNPNPTVTASSTASSVCAGTMVTLTGGGATSYTWDNSVMDGVAFTPSATLIYTVTGTDGNGCTATASVNVAVNSLPSVTASSTASAVCAGTMVTLNGGGAITYTWDNSVSDGVAFTPSATTLYTVTGTDGAGCSSTASVTVTVNANPSVISSFSPIVCNGGSTMVTITGAGGTSPYTSGEGSFIQFAGPATYSVTDAAGCTGSTTLTLTEPAAITTSQNADLCAGQSVTVGTNTYMTAGTYTDVLVAANGCDSTVTTTVTNVTVDVTTTQSGATIMANDVSATGYQWLDCNAGMAPIAGETNQTFVATADGSYAVEVTSNGCVDTSACVMVIGTGINAGGSNTMIVYPNPTSGVFNLSFENADFSELLINIVDIQGKLVYSSSEKNVNGAYNKVINLEELSKGLYYIKVNTGADVKIQKLTIQ